MDSCQPIDAVKSDECRDVRDSDDLRLPLSASSPSNSVDGALRPNQTGRSKDVSRCVDMPKRKKSSDSCGGRQQSHTAKPVHTVGHSSNAVDIETHVGDNAAMLTVGKAESDAARARNRPLRLAAASSSPGQYATDFRCDVCDQVCESKAKLKLHVAGHSKPYECSKCSRRFSFKHVLTLHMHRHEGTLPLSSSACGVCGKRFASECYLRLHASTHTGERPHPCDVCGQRFRYRVYLRQHMLVHTGELPYKCDVCGQSFRQVSHLRTHLLHHSGVKPYECSVCGRRFRQTSHRNRHMLLHTGERPHVCQVCGRRFSHTDNLRQHMLQHTGERPYACSVCGHRVTCSSALRSHEVTHTGVRPYVCDLCDRAFVLRWRLRRHREAEHPDAHAADEAEARRRERGLSPSSAPAKAASVAADRRDTCRHECRQCGQRFGSKGALTWHQETVHAPGQKLPQEQQAVMKQLSREQWAALVKLASNSRRQPFVLLFDCMKPPRSCTRSS